MSKIIKTIYSYINSFSVSDTKYMGIVNKINVYLILYPFLYLITSLIIIITIRSLFTYNLVYAESINTETSQITEETEKNKKTYLYWMLGIMGAIITTLFLWYQYEKNISNDDITLYGFDEMTEVSIPLIEYSVAAYNLAVAELNKGHNVTEDTIFQFCFLNLASMNDNRFHCETLRVNSKESLLSNENSILNQIVRVYAHMYTQLTNKEQLVAKNLAIAHITYMYMPPEKDPIDFVVEMNENLYMIAHEHFMTFVGKKYKMI